MHLCLPALALLSIPVSFFAQPAGKPGEKPGTAKPSSTTPAMADLKSTTPELHTGTEARHERFNQISKEGKAKLVFLGDSITQGWENPGNETWAKHYAHRDAANFGISGDRTEHALWRLDHGNFDGLSPKLIVIMIGTNNMGNQTEEAIAAGNKAILDEIQKKHPQAKILLLGIFPRSPKAGDPVRAKIKKTNEMLAKFDDGKTVKYLDIGEKFLDKDGNLSKDIMPDYLHLSKKGYHIWAEAIEEDLGKMVK